MDEDATPIIRFPLREIGPLDAAESKETIAIRGGVSPAYSETIGMLLYLQKLKAQPFKQQSSHIFLQQQQQPQQQQQYQNFVGSADSYGGSNGQTNWQNRLGHETSKTLQSLVSMPPPRPLENYNKWPPDNFKIPTFPSTPVMKFMYSTEQYHSSASLLSGQYKVFIPRTPEGFMINIHFVENSRYTSAVSGYRRHSNNIISFIEEQGLIRNPGDVIIALDDQSLEFVQFEKVYSMLTQKAASCSLCGIYLTLVNNATLFPTIHPYHTLCSSQAPPQNLFTTGQYEYCGTNLPTPLEFPSRDTKVVSSVDFAQPNSYISTRE